MKRTKKLLFLLLVAVSSLCNGQNLEEGALVVLLKEEYANTDFHTVAKANGREIYKFQHPTGKKIFDKYTITKLERTYPGIEKYNHPNIKILSRYYTIRGNFKRDRVMLSVIEDGGDFFEDVEPLTVDVPLYITNDFNLEPSSQKHLEMIKAKEAWDITKGDRAVKIAVTDPRGFFFGHPDYVNSNGTNQISYRSPQADDQDLGSAAAHGLQVSSCVAIATDNGKGISAIGFNTSLMAFNSGLTQMLSASYDHGASVVEASWFNSCNFRTSDQLIIDMIYDNGTTIIVAAGNGDSGGSCPSPDGEGNGLTYPASYNHVISVGGVNTVFADMYTINSGSHLTFNDAVDITAPGWAIGTASILKNSDGTFNSYDYSTASGTSFAAPIVAGTVGLMLSIKPDLSPDAVEYVIESTSDFIDNLPGNEIYAGKAGAGRINAYEAVKYVNECFGCDQTTEVPIFANYFPAALEGVCKIEIGNVDLHSGESINYTASQQIVIKPGFSASSGSTVHLKIADKCSLIANSTSSRKKGALVNHITYRELLEAGKIEIPEENILENNQEEHLYSYPNPSNSKTTFSYIVEHPAIVQLALRSVTGNILEVIVGEYQESGLYQVDYNVSNLAPGLYFYTLQYGAVHISKQLIVVK